MRSAEPQDVVHEAFLVGDAPARHETGRHGAPRARRIVLLHSANEPDDAVRAREVRPDRDERRGADAAATRPRRDDEGDRGAVVRVDLGVDECDVPAPKLGDQAEAIAHDAAAVFARARRD